MFRSNQVERNFDVLPQKEKAVNQPQTPKHQTFWFLGLFNYPFFLLLLKQPNNSINKQIFFIDNFDFALWTPFQTYFPAPFSALINRDEAFYKNIPKPVTLRLMFSYGIQYRINQNIFSSLADYPACQYASHKQHR